MADDASWGSGRYEHPQTLCFELQALLASGDVRPTDLLVESQRQYQQQNPNINAFTSFDWEGAFQRAEQLEAQGFSADLPLFGMPIAIKDNFYVAGQPTTWGSLNLRTLLPTEPMYMFNV